MNCLCGCGQEAKEGNRYINGHNLTKEIRIKNGKRTHDLYLNLARENGKKSSEMNRKNGVGFFGKDFHKNNLENCRKGGESFVRMYGGWSGLHKNLKEKNPEKYYQILKNSGRKGGNSTISKYGGWAWLDCSENGKKGAEKNRKNKSGPFFNPEIRKISCSHGGKNCTKKHGGWAWIDHHKNGLNTVMKIRLNKPYYYNNIPHDSGEERKVSNIFCNFGMDLVEGKTVHVRIGRKEFDWKSNGLNKFGIEDDTFIEYHPWDKNKTDKEYYEERRKVLDKNGYENNELIVVKSIKQLEDLLSKVQMIEQEVY